MVTSFRRRLLAALALAAIGLTLGACQEARSVAAVNQCGADVEVKASSISDSSNDWTRISAAGEDTVVDVPEGADTLYVDVRAAGTEEARRFDVPITSLGKPPDGADYEALLVLEGDRCP